MRRSRRQRGGAVLVTAAAVLGLVACSPAGTAGRGHMSGALAPAAAAAGSAASTTAQTRVSPPAPTPTRAPRSRAGRTVGGAPRTAFRPGSAGVGDPYFPLEGNGGYDVAHYDLALTYRPATRQLDGVARITATAHQSLSRFDLDLSGMTVHSVSVNGAHAAFRRSGQELQITPPRGLRRGTRFVVAVDYGGRPHTVSGSPIVFGADYGWQYTGDGSFVGDEPNAAHTWYPCNDHPTDKASFTFHVTVPSNRQVVANGDLRSRRTNGSTTTFVWRETKPMATYLATVDIGNWRYRTGRTPGGIPETVAYDPSLQPGVQRRHVFRLSGAITDYWTKIFGRYPFTSTGAIVDNLPSVGFSLETQTRPLYGFAPDAGTMSHELAHQWFGDSVSVHSWRDIWLNEGFATFAAWLWTEHTQHRSTYASARAVYRSYRAGSAFWKQSVADPRRDTMFSQAVYQRGGMTLAALRARIGDTDFFRLLRRWTATHRYGTATTHQFIALAQRVSGRHLTAFFRTWLRAPRKPASFDAP